MTLQQEMAFLGPQEVHLHLLRVEESWGFQDNALSRRHVYTQSRRLIRRVAGLYLKKDPGEIRFGFLEGGKPVLENTRLRFNLSHTEGLIICSFSWREVGVDVEKIDLSPRAFQRGRQLAERYFSKQEKDFLRAQPLQSQGLAFLRIFTLKEAYVKALGLGLSFPFHSFTAPLVFGRPRQDGRWTWLNQMIGSKEYSLSQVVENPHSVPLSFKVYEWNEHFRPSLGERANFHAFSSKALVGTPS